MQKEIRLLYSSNEIYKYFKKGLILDYYDNLTMETYVKKNVGDLSIEELKTMLNTLKNDKEINNINQSNATNTLNSIISLLSIVCAVSVAFYVVFLSYLISQGKTEIVPDSLLFMKGILGFLVIYSILIGILFINSTIKNTKINKLQKFIQITITIKKAELMNNIDFT